MSTHPQAPQDRIAVSRDTVVAGLLAEATDRSGGATPATRLKAWELLAKVCGFLNPKEDSGREKGRVAVHYDFRMPGPDHEDD